MRLDPMPSLQTVILMTWQNQPADHVSLEMHSGFVSFFFSSLNYRRKVRLAKSSSGLAKPKLFEKKKKNHKIFCPNSKKTLILFEI